MSLMQYRSLDEAEGEGDVNEKDQESYRERQRERERDREIESYIKISFINSQHTSFIFNTLSDNPKALSVLYIPPPFSTYCDP